MGDIGLGGTDGGAATGGAGTTVAVGGGGVDFVTAGAGEFTVGRGLTRSGNSFGAIAAQSQSRPIETRTATKIRFSISGNGVPAPGIEHVTARQTPNSQPTAAQDAVPFDRLHHVHRAGRIEATHGWQKRRKNAFIDT